LLPEAYIASNKILDYTMINKYTSKKNIVTAFQITEESGQSKLIILKEFSNQVLHKKEVKYLTYLYNSGSLVPEILYASDNIIIMEFIKGKLLIDALFEQRFNNCEYIIKLLLESLRDIYNKLSKISNRQNSLILGDMNLRNFILSGDRVYRLDLESIKAGKLSQDFGQLLAFIVSYDPPFNDYKWGLVKIIFNKLIKEMKVEPGAMAQAMKTELRRIEKRRKIKINQKEIDKISKYLLE